MATDSCRSTYLAGLFFLVILSACKMGPDYHRPETTKADSWRLTAATAESIAQFALVGTVEGSGSAAIGPHGVAGKPGFADRRRQHRTVSGSAHDRQVRSGSLARLLRSRLGLPEHQRQCPSDRCWRHSVNFPTPGKSGVSLSHEGVNVGLKWELDLWGRIRRSIEAAGRNCFPRRRISERSSSDWSATWRRRISISADWITRSRSAQRTLKSWDESVRLSELRFKQGAIPKLDLDRFQAERAGTAAQLADLERQVVQTENRLEHPAGTQTDGDCERGSPHRANHSA